MLWNGKMEGFSMKKHLSSSPVAVKQQQVRPVVWVSIIAMFTILIFGVICFPRKPIAPDMPVTVVTTSEAVMADGVRTNSAVLVVEKGATFSMMAPSNNQPTPVSETEILARQNAAREAQKVR